MNNHFIAGYFNADGYFSISKLGKYQSFQIGITKDKINLSVLKHIQKFLQCGVINKKPPRAYQFRINTQTDVRLFCTYILPLMHGTARKSGDKFFKKLKKYTKKGDSK